MKRIVFTCLLAVLFAACSEPEAEWPNTLAIQSTDNRTSWRVVIVADVTADEAVVEIPDYATEVIIIRDGTGSVIAHMSPDLGDFVLSRDQDSLRIRVNQ